MPLIDMAEAISRGEIIVDEVDALNAVNSGKLSEIETARFSPLVIEHSRRQSVGNGSAFNHSGCFCQIRRFGEINSYYLLME